MLDLIGWVQGASGAVYSLLAFYAACFPRSTFLLFFVVPVPAWVSRPPAPSLATRLSHLE